MYPQHNTVGLAVGGQYGEKIANQYAQTDAAYPPAQKDPGLMEVMERRLTEHLDQLHTLNMRLRSVGDGVFGVRPEEAGTQGAPVPNPEACIARLSQLLDWINQRTSALADEIARVERL